MWDSAVSLEAQGTITVVMMLEGDFFEWIAWRYGFLNGLQIDTGTVWMWIWLSGVVKIIAYPCLGVDELMPFSIIKRS